MKEKVYNLLIILVLCMAIMQSLFSALIKPQNNNVYLAQTPSYAQIKNSNTYLYKSAEFNDVNNKWCLLENTYFVKILNNYNSSCYKVEYNGITGFVKKDEVTLINETPITPYPSSITFSIGQTNCYMRLSPQIKDVTDNTICVIPANTTGLKYIGKIIGEEAVDFKGSVWYLTEYNGNIGYVYSGYTTSINAIAENIEQVSLFTENDFSKINPLTNSSCIALIVITLTPCLFILFLLYSPKKVEKHKVKPNSLTPSNKDYANFYDENL